MTLNKLLGPLLGLILAGATLLPLNASAALVSHWKFEGNFNDEVGGNSGSAAGTTGSFQAGMDGQGWKSAGQGSVALVPDANNLDVSQFTIEAWIKLDGLNLWNSAFIWKGNSAGQDSSSPFSLAVRGTFDGNNAGKLLTTIGDGSNGQYLLGQTALSLGVFHHVAVSVEAAQSVFMWTVSWRGKPPRP